ncbi:hypothetical protein ACSFA0_14845 [Variovorax sp. LT1P1]|uniref:hypothetical protein n=1 Tax=Variovorax sp. LT1P1 TaxID=3443730 RepID=UPI003F47EE64
MARTGIVITFDLHDVPNSQKSRIYSNIKRDLAGLALNKFIIKTDGTAVGLPRNTFVGILEGRLFERDAGQVRDVARTRVKEIVLRHHSSATIFVFVGKSWAWGRSKL